MSINWIKNNNESLLQDIYNKLDSELIFNRLCYELKCSREELFNKVEEDEILYLIANILINRNITSKEDIDKYFNVIGQSINTPYILTNAEKAADKILEYLFDENAYIYIFADYDADGLTAGYVFTSALRDLAKCHVIIKYPERIEGYGLNMDWCKSIVELDNNNPKLVITVDNGISKIEEVDYLKANNIEVIITDHHTSDKRGVPNCLIVDPHNEHEEQNENTKYLCGCGVAFKIAQIIHEKNNTFNMLKYIPFLAISTLTDVMKLSAENMAIIQFGLEIMNGKDCPIQLKVLLNKLGIDIATSNDILWSIGPLLNACGRMGNTSLGAKILFTTDEDELNDIINCAIKLNDERKKITKNVKKEISELNFDNDNVAIFFADDYQRGMLSIIAGKLKDEFEIPSFCCNHLNKDIIHCSIRSVDNLDILTILKDLEKKGLIISCGGHKEACVCNVKTEKFDEFKKVLNDTIVLPIIEEDEISEEKIIDEYISFNHLNEAVYALVNLLPSDNRQIQSPTFSIYNLEVVKYKVSNNNPNNLCLTVKNGRTKKDIWAWGLSNLYIEQLQCPKNISLIGEISKNIMGYGYVLNVKDIVEC